MQDHNNLKALISESITQAILPLTIKINELSQSNSDLKRKITNLLKVSNPEEILTVSEVAIILKKKDTTIRKWCRDGKIESSLRGNTYEIKRSALKIT